MSARLPESLVLIGAGKMGQALADGWLKLGLDPARVIAVDPHLDEAGRARLAAQGIARRDDVAGLAPPEVLLLAIKPQTLEAAAPSLAALAGPDTLVVSILAGKRIADIRPRCPGAGAIVRAMPNTPAAVGRGITALVAEPATSAARRDLAAGLLSAVGKVVWLDEEHLIDAVTAVSGSGPAYVFHLVEAMAQAGVAAGLPADLAMALARATVEGSGELLFRSSETPETLRRNVTSPGGTTAAALAHLMDQETGLPPLMTRAIGAAKRRAEELSG